MSSWSHPYINTLTPEELTEQMTQLEVALVDIIGKYPTYMRPPYFEWDDENLDTLGELGYKVIHADIDTLDWAGDIPASITNFINGIADGGSIVLAHEVHEATVKTLVPAMLSALKIRGLRCKSLFLLSLLIVREVG
ncbi:polysaccharide deacetylase family protein [Candidatus Bathyarchaeota archaeon]|nr:polysaccharide deacetylase family protein [Candidatus Bathyarchaeota archaeon]